MQSQDQSSEPPATTDSCTHGLPHGLQCTPSVCPRQDDSEGDHSTWTHQCLLGTPEADVSTVSRSISAVTLLVFMLMVAKSSLLKLRSPLGEKPYLNFVLLLLFFELESSLELLQGGSVDGVLSVLKLNDLIKHGSELIQKCLRTGGKKETVRRSYTALCLSAAVSRTPSRRPHQRQRGPRLQGCQQASGRNGRASPFHSLFGATHTRTRQGGYEKRD